MTVIYFWELATKRNSLQQEQVQTSAKSYIHLPHLPSQSLLLWKFSWPGTHKYFKWCSFKSACIFPGKESRTHCLSPGQMCLLLKQSCPACRALLHAHTAAALPEAKTAYVRHRQRKTGKSNTMPGAWLSGHGRFCKCFIIGVVICITPKVPSHLSAAYLWKPSSNAGSSLVCFLLQLFLILQVNICSHGSRCQKHLTSRQWLNDSV